MIENLEDEVVSIQSTLASVLNERTRATTICAISRQWWNDDIRTNEEISVELAEGEGRARPQTRSQGKKESCTGQSGGPGESSGKVS